MKKSMLTLFALSALISSNMFGGALPANPSIAQAPTPTPTSMRLAPIEGSPMNTTIRDSLANERNNVNRSWKMHDTNNQDQDNDGLENQLQQLDSDAGKAFSELKSQWQNIESTASNDWNQLKKDWQSIESKERMNHMDRMRHFDDMMHNMASKLPTMPVQDSKGNIIGQYKMNGDIKGYHYGSFYTNVNQSPQMAIANITNQGTPVTVAVPGASSTIIGYIENPKYNDQMQNMNGGQSKMITLYQYTMQAQQPANNVKVQSYNHNNDDSNDNHKHNTKNRRHHDDEDSDNHHHHLITLF